MITTSQLIFFSRYAIWNINCMPLYRIIISDMYSLRVRAGYPPFSFPDSNLHLDSRPDTRGGQPLQRRTPFLVRVEMFTLTSLSSQLGLGIGGPLGGLINDWSVLFHANKALAFNSLLSQARLAIGFHTTNANVCAVICTDIVQSELRDPCRFLASCSSSIALTYATRVKVGVREKFSHE